MASGIFGRERDPLDQNAGGNIRRRCFGRRSSPRKRCWNPFRPRSSGLRFPRASAARRANPWSSWRAALTSPSSIQPANFPRVPRVRGDPEISGRGEMFDQLPALGAVVQVINGQRDVADVGVGRIPEDHQLNQRGKEKDDAHPGIAESLDEFLDEHGFQALPHGSADPLLKPQVRPESHPAGIEGQEKRLDPENLQADPL